MTKFIFIIGMIGAILSLAAAPKAETKDVPISNSPLILDHSDLLNASRGDGVFELMGHIRMHHDQMKVRCERAVWNQRLGILDAQKNLFFEHPEALVDADSGRYEKGPSLATAWGNARYRTRDEKLWITGQRMSYMRLQRLVDVWNDAALTDIPKSHKKNTDTLYITADHLKYDDNSKIAYAWGSVKVKQGALRLRCDSAIYQRNDSTLWLNGHAYGRYRGWRSTAEKMHSIGGGKQLKMLEGFGSAVGIALADTTGRDSIHIRNKLLGDTLRAYFSQGKISEVWGIHHASGHDYRDSIPKGSKDSLRSIVVGDSLHAKFLQGQMHEILTFPKAQGTFFGDKMTEDPSLANGDSLRMTFKDNKADTAWILGHAKTTYQYYKDLLKQGRNECEGKRTTLIFNGNKIRTVETIGELAKGTWYGIKIPKPNKDSLKNKDSLALKDSSHPMDLNSLNKIKKSDSIQIPLTSPNHVLDSIKPQMGKTSLMKTLDMFERIASIDSQKKGQHSELVSQYATDYNTISSINFGICETRHFVDKYSL